NEVRETVCPAHDSGRKGVEFLGVFAIPPVNSLSVNDATTTCDLSDDARATAPHSAKTHWRQPSTRLSGPKTSAFSPAIGTCVKCLFGGLVGVFWQEGFSDSSTRDYIDVHL